jgi:uncharacterized membrane protein
VVFWQPMFRTEVAPAVLTSERQERFLSTLLAHHCIVFTSICFFERGAYDVYMFLFSWKAALFVLSGFHF